MGTDSVRVCPNCGSVDVTVARENVTELMGFEHEYRCANCGFTSKVFPELPVENLEEYEEEFQDAFPNRFLDPESWRHGMRPRRSWLLAGGLLVLFGASAIPYPGTVSPLTAAVMVIVAGIAVALYELHR